MIQKKCAQYWPDEGSLTYGGIKVTLDKKEPYSDFIIRTFAISKVHGFYICKRLHLLRHRYTKLCMTSLISVLADTRMHQACQRPCLRLRPVAKFYVKWLEFLW